MSRGKHRKPGLPNLGLIDWVKQPWRPDPRHLSDAELDRAYRRFTVSWVAFLWTVVLVGFIGPNWWPLVRLTVGPESGSVAVALLVIACAVMGVVNWDLSHPERSTDAAIHPSRV